MEEKIKMPRVFNCQLRNNAHGPKPITNRKLELNLSENIFFEFHAIGWSKNVYVRIFFNYFAICAIFTSLIL